MPKVRNGAIQYSSNYFWGKDGKKIAKLNLTTTADEEGIFLVAQRIRDLVRHHVDHAWNLLKIMQANSECNFVILSNHAKWHNNPRFGTSKIKTFQIEMAHDTYG